MTTKAKMSTIPGSLKKIAAGLLMVVMVLSVSTFFMPASADAFSLVYTCQGNTLKGPPDTGQLPNGERECDFVDFIGQIDQLINDAFILAVPISIIVITYAGVKLMTSRGNSSAMSEAKKMLTKSITGFVIICAAWIVVYFIITSLGCTTCTEFLGSGPSSTGTPPSTQTAAPSS